MTIKVSRGLKKMGGLISAVFLLIAGACSTIFPAQKNTVPASVKFGTSQLAAGILDKSSFDAFVSYGRQLVARDSKSTNEEKKKAGAGLDRLKFVNSKFLYFVIVSDHFFSNRELLTKFQIVDTEGHDFFEDSALVPIAQDFGTKIIYRYIFVISSMEPLGNVLKGSALNLVATLSDGSTSTLKVN